jgi:hypothetical protein
MVAKNRSTLAPDQGRSRSHCVRFYSRAGADLSSYACKIMRPHLGIGSLRGIHGIQNRPQSSENAQQERFFRNLMVECKSIITINLLTISLGLKEILKKYGGETGIRTLDTLRYTRFPSVRLQPLGHLSAIEQLFESTTLEEARRGSQCLANVGRYSRLTSSGSSTTELGHQRRLAGIHSRAKLCPITHIMYSSAISAG